MPGAEGCGAQMGQGGRSPRAPPREQHGRGGLMPKIEVDGRPVEVPHGATVMDATNKLGVYVPHFCYHRKLSIAANCRMCLVEVEKAPKPLPACATPVTDGMKVWTNSPAAKKAQNGVMEFLLINHPLDCPICDQGGECQLQDLAVGYGPSNSRYTEEKRVVLRKELGPLVAAEEMSRCIQCTRCVRFGQEIAGKMELGLAGRGEKAEIVSFVNHMLESELSGNMIDLCPVGALTSGPFRYTARTWELSRRKSVSPHDGLGSNLVVQVKQSRVMRVLPLDNDAINECWLSDKDRFSYEGLNAPGRLKRPMVKRGAQREPVDWEVALEVAVWGLKKQDFGVLASPHSTLEELYLAGTLGRVLVVGSFLRKDHPLIAHRLRQAAKRGTQIHMLHSEDDDWAMPIASKRIVPPSKIPDSIASFAEALKGGKNAAVLLGNFAQQHPLAAQIHAEAQALGVRLGFLGEAANSVGGYLAGLPAGGNVNSILARKALVLLHCEPELDFADSRAATRAVNDAELVVQLSAFETGLEYAEVLLPITPFTETAGTFVNTEGRLQSFYAAVNPLGESRPAWKVLRVLGTLLGKPGTGYDSIDEARADCLRGRDVSSLLSNATQVELSPVSFDPPGIQRIADVPIYFADPLVRRSVPLQKTPDSQPPRAWMNAKLMARRGISAGQLVLVEGAARLPAALDDRLPDECVRVAAAHPSTAQLGPMFGTVSLKKVAVERAA